MEKNLTTGSVFGNIVRFSLPYLLSYFLQTLYGMADLFIIGQYEGVASTTAVSIGSQVMHMLTVMIVGLAMGATVTIGQAVGARDRRGAAGYIGNTTTLFLALSVVVTGVLLALARPIAAVMSTPAEAVPAGWAPARADGQGGYHGLVTAGVTGKTGSEMEALTGASAACLTIYDMCKAVDRGMEIVDVRLLH